MKSISPELAGQGVDKAPGGVSGRAGVWFRGISSFCRRNPLGAVGAFIIAVMFVVAAFADQITPYDPYSLRVDSRFHAPSADFWFGTDNYGRDLFTRILHGSRISLVVGFFSVLLGTAVGGVLGLVSGFFGGKTDSIVQRVMDSLLAFPTLILALAVVAALGQGRMNVIFAIALVLTPTVSRVVRSSALSVRNNLYIDSARVIGCSKLRILSVHVLPNCMAPVIVLASIALGTSIITESSLSFLGLGTPPPEPSWGAMLSGGAQRFVREAPWMGIFPGIAISLAVLAFNLFGDALRDTLDPRLRSR